MDESEIDKTIQTLYFERVAGDERLSCTIEECADGSVYVNSEEFEILYEFTDNALERAVERVTSVGYRQVKSLPAADGSQSME